MVKIIYYDITDNKGRTKIHDYLEAQGFERIQFSVFIGKIDRHRWQKVWARLSSFHAQYCSEEDKIYAHNIQAEHFEKMSKLGNGPDTDWILQKTEVLFI